MQKVHGNQCKIFYILVIIIFSFFLSSCNNDNFILTDKLFSRYFRMRNNYDELQITSLEKYTYIEDITNGNNSHQTEWSIYNIKYTKLESKIDYNMVYIYENKSFFNASSIKDIDLWKNDFPKTYELYNKVVIYGKYNEYKEFKEEEWKILFSFEFEV